MEKTQKRKVGDTGEDVAAKYLANRGFIVVDRNYLRPWGELDIVAKKGGKLHFIEVKTVRLPKELVSREPHYIRPEENMHRKKILRLNRAIQTYLLEKKVSQKVEWQIDLLCIYLDFSTRRAKVEVLENISL